MTKVDYKVSPGAPLKGAVRVPGDKSISHRALMFGAIATGDTEIQGLLAGRDCLATLSILRALGISVETESKGEHLDVCVKGKGLFGFSPPNGVLDCENSGTTMRLMAGILAGQPFSSVLVGDESLSQRPMGRIMDPLREMGACLEGAHGGTHPPLTLTGGQTLTGQTFTLTLPSAQLKSCVLLAGLHAKGRTQIVEAGITRDHTERMLEAFGYPIVHTKSMIEIQGQGQLHATTVQVPADISSAAFFMVGATLVKGSKITLKQVGLNPTRTGICHILKQMGARIRIEQMNKATTGQEPLGDIHVESSDLQGIEIPESLVPIAIDEFPILFVAAACAKGTTVLRHAKELRVKETDRIKGMVLGLRALGIQVQELEDGVIIEGGTFTGGEVDSLGDHRLAMAFSMAGLCAPSPIIIKQCANVATSFPNFVSVCRSLGINIGAIE